ncbi:MAG: HypC/HybG/HupF family hydrogenase formation chaperone [Dehalococcoidales bacterium]|nr:HypC/HybG/HupF family hydrogenase formation chaperone [Dehalococcoidales bacterium]
MCLAVPARVLKIDGLKALVELGGLTRQASIVLVPDTQVGDYILLHAGFAIQKLDEREAKETIRLFAELAEGVGDYS